MTSFSPSALTSPRTRLLTSCTRQRRATVLVLFLTGVVFGQVSFHFMIPRVPGGNSSWCGLVMVPHSSGTSESDFRYTDTVPGTRNRQAGLRQVGESIPIPIGDSTLVTDDHGSALSPLQPPQLLFVGVMTSRRYLRTRARAIHETWGRVARQDGGSLVFFVGGGDNVTDSDFDGPPLRVQVLPDVVDSEYPPRRKSFAMLDWMSRNCGHRYDWFMRADDDMFVDVTRLRALLSSLDGSAPLYLGHPGTGKVGEEGKLGLPSGAPYCMGGTGVLVSRDLLTSLAGKLSGCLENTASDHEDSELGRCVHNVTGVACVQSERTYRRFKQNYDDTSGQWIGRALKTSRPYVTFHPVKDIRYMYHSAALVESQRVVKLQNKVRQLEADIACLQETTRFPRAAVGGNGETPLGSEQAESDAAEKSRSDGNCSGETAALPAAWRSPACELGKRRVRFSPRAKCPSEPSSPRGDNGLDPLPWSLVHRGTFHALWATGFIATNPAGHAGVSEGLTLMLRHLSRYVSAESGREGQGGRDSGRPPRSSSARQRPPAQRRRLVAVDRFYRRVTPGAGVEYVTFVRGGKSAKLRPYVVRQEFDTPVAAETLVVGPPVSNPANANAGEELRETKGWEHHTEAGVR